MQLAWQNRFRMPSMTIFALMLPDDVIESTVAMREMIRVRKEHGGSVLLAVEVRPSLVPNFGEFDVVTTNEDRVKRKRERWKSRS